MNLYDTTLTPEEKAKSLIDFFEKMGNDTNSAYSLSMKAIDVIITFKTIKYYKQVKRELLIYIHKNVNLKTETK